MAAAAMPLRTVGKAAGVITIAFVGFMVFAHLPGGKRLLAPIMGAKCPVGNASAADVEAARAASARESGGTQLAPARPALGFELEKTKPADIKAWAAAQKVTCDEERDGALLKCHQVRPEVLQPASEGPPLDDVVFAFEPKQMTLVNMTAYYNATTEEIAARRLSRVHEALLAKLGKPDREAGGFDAAYLSAGTGQTTVVSYRFKDYQADVTAVRRGPGNVMLREHYMTGGELGHPAP